MSDKYACPLCKDKHGLIYLSNGEIYCEECGWPDSWVDEIDGIPGEKSDRVSKQTMQACASNEVTCCCGKTLPVWVAFRCLYCGEYYCQRCAEIHFRETRKEYNKKLEGA